jgi:hypothetical protein
MLRRIACWLRGHKWARHSRLCPKGPPHGSAKGFVCRRCSRIQDETCDDCDAAWIALGGREIIGAPGYDAMPPRWWIEEKLRERWGYLP